MSLAHLIPVHAQPLPFGVYPCLTNDIPSGYGSFVFIKSTSYLQNSLGAVAEVDGGSRALIELISPVDPSITNAVVNGPGDIRLPLSTVESGSRTLSWSATFPSETALDVALPAGAWNTRIAVHSTPFGSFVGFFPFAPTADAPPVPRFANSETIGLTDPNTNHVVSWDPWPGLAVEDRIHFEVIDARGDIVFSASTDCSGSARLTPGATSVEIPGGTLKGQARYTFYLTFGGALFASQDRSAQLVERGYQARTTRLNVTTGGPAANDATLTDPRYTAAGDAIIFRLTGEPRTVYHIQWSTNLTSWNFQNAITLPASGLADVRLPLDNDGTVRLWRATRPSSSDEGSAATLTIEPATRDRMLITIQGTPGIVYRLESTTNFVTWNRLPFGLNVSPATGRAVFAVLYSRGPGINAYRVVSATP
ncbi:MAG: hypothetical protein JNK85_28305 [Verrucomicrobiales bacterium]|nr:hypothetical protein [Verrucomicrobiales bacterium]